MVTSTILTGRSAKDLQGQLNELLTNIHKSGFKLFGELQFSVTHIGLGQLYSVLVVYSTISK